MPLSAPTDNLYKFVAVSGVLLVFLCIWSGVQLVESQNTLSAEVTARAMRLNAELELAKGPEKDALSVDRADVEARLQAAATRLGFVNQAMSVLLAAMMVGIAMGTWGFREWYFRVQVHEDAMLAKRAKESQGEAT